MKFGAYMKTMQIKDAKVHFIETGRLNRNIIRDEISISWYKCKLSQLDHSKKTFSYEDKKRVSLIEPKFIEFIDSIIPASLDYWILDEKSNVVNKRSENCGFEDIWNVEEENIGTNAAALAIRYESFQKVLYDEHYLDYFSSICTYAIPIKQDEQIVAIITLISKDSVNEYAINQVTTQLSKYHEKRLVTKPLSRTNYKIEEVITYPKVYLGQLKEDIEKLRFNHSMILINGDSGSGRSSLSWFLGLSVESFPYYLASESLPENMERKVIENALFHNRTVIIDDIEKLNESTINLLMVYNNEKFHSKKSSKYSDFSAENIILTTAYNGNKSKVYKGFVDILKINQVNLKSIEELVDYKSELSHLIKKKYHFDLDPVDIEDKWMAANPSSFKSLILILSQNHEQNKIHTLEDNEKNHILQVLKYTKFNISLASETLGVSRSTLYRKLNKYHIDTETPNSK